MHVFLSFIHCMKDFPHTNHKYDVWHLSKWMVKKLTKPNKRVARNWPLGYNPFPIAFGGAKATSDGNVQLLREKWKS